jgi:hypothetical protein
MADVPGCELWLVQRNLDDPGMIRVTEMWASRRHCDAASGSGHIKVDDQRFELRPRDAVRVAPASARELEAGPDGLEVLAFGSHYPGDGEMVADWWTP